MAGAVVTVRQVEREADRGLPASLARASVILAELRVDSEARLTTPDSWRRVRDAVGRAEVEIGGMLGSATLTAFLQGALSVYREARSAGVVDIAASSEAAAKFLRKRARLTVAQVADLRGHFGREAAQVAGAIGRKAQRALDLTLADATARGLNRRDVKKLMREEFKRQGIAPRNKFTVEATLRTQRRVAFEAGREAGYQDPAVQQALWGFQYRTVGDARVRDSHAALDGVKASKGDQFWLTHTPPNGWACRCLKIALFDGPGRGKLKRPPMGSAPDKGFAFFPGSVHQRAVELLKNARQARKVAVASEQLSAPLTLGLPRASARRVGESNDAYAARLRRNEASKKSKARAKQKEIDRREARVGEVGVDARVAELEAKIKALDDAKDARVAELRLKSKRKPGESRAAFGKRMQANEASVRSREKGALRKQIEALGGQPAPKVVSPAPMPAAKPPPAFSSNVTFDKLKKATAEAQLTKAEEGAVERWIVDTTRTRQAQQGKFPKGATDRTRANMKARLASLESAWSKLPKVEGRLFRGIRFYESEAELQQLFGAGQTLDGVTFSSWSRKQSVARHFAHTTGERGNYHRVVVHCENGYGASLEATPLSPFAWQQEVLVEAGEQLVVTSIKKVRQIGKVAAEWEIKVKRVLGKKLPGKKLPSKVFKSDALYDELEEATKKAGLTARETEAIVQWADGDHSRIRMLQRGETSVTDWHQGKMQTKHWTKRYTETTQQRLDAMESACDRLPQMEGEMWRGLGLMDDAKRPLNEAAIRKMFATGNEFGGKNFASWSRVEDDVAHFLDKQVMGTRVKVRCANMRGTAIEVVAPYGEKEVLARAGTRMVVRSVKQEWPRGIPRSLARPQWVVEVERVPGKAIKAPKLKPASKVKYPPDQPLPLEPASADDYVEWVAEWKQRNPATMPALERLKAATHLEAKVKRMQGAMGEIRHAKDAWQTEYNAIKKTLPGVGDRRGRAKVWARLDAHKKREPKLAEMTRERFLRALEERAPKGGAALNVSAIGESAAFKGRIKKAADFLGRAQAGAGERVAARTTATSIRRGGRASADKFGINCAPSDNIKTFVHELGHVMEHKIPNAQSLTRSFRRARTKAAPADRQVARSFKDTLSEAYKANERGALEHWDKFFGKNDAYYAGKVYKNGSTELLSMGFQALWDDPLKFAQKDPEFVKFLLGVLDGSLL